MKTFDRASKRHGATGLWPHVPAVVRSGMLLFKRPSYVRTCLTCVAIGLKATYSLGQIKRKWFYRVIPLSTHSNYSAVPCFSKTSCRCQAAVHLIVRSASSLLQGWFTKARLVPRHIWQKQKSGLRLDSRCFRILYSQRGSEGVTGWRVKTVHSYQS